MRLLRLKNNFKFKNCKFDEQKESRKHMSELEICIININIRNLADTKGNVMANLNITKSSLDK